MAWIIIAGFVLAGISLAVPTKFLVKKFATKRGTLDIILSVLGVVVVAFATLGLEDVLDVDPFDWRPLLLFLVFGIVGGKLLFVRGQIAYQRGTLLYLRLLYEFMADLHDISVETRVRGQAEHKVISRWINPGSVVGVVNELTPEVSAITLEAERSLNEDTAETGTHVAPNMFWPAAMAVGYDLAELSSSQIELIEFLPSVRGDASQKDVGTGGQRRSAADSMDWRLRQPDPEKDAVPSHGRTPEGRGGRCWCGRSVKGTLSSASEPTVVWTDEGPSSPPRLVLLTVELTGEGRASVPRWTPDVWGRLAVYPAADPQADFEQRMTPDSGQGIRSRVLMDMDTRPVEVATDSSEAIRLRAIRAHRDRLKQRTTDDTGRPRPSLEEFRTTLAVVRPDEAAISCWSAIRTALHRYPFATLMVVMRVPKSVGLAVGTLLATAWKSRGNPGCGHRCFQASCMNPWTKLVLLNWHDGKRDYEIVRVHRSQRSVDEFNVSFSPVVGGHPW